MEKFFRSAHPQSDATEAKWFWLNIFVNEKYFKLDHQSILKYINIPAHPFDSHWGHWSLYVYKLSNKIDLLSNVLSYFSRMFHSVYPWIIPPPHSCLGLTCNDEIKSSFLQEKLCQWLNIYTHVTHYKKINFNETQQNATVQSSANSATILDLMALGKSILSKSNILLLDQALVMAIWISKCVVPWEPHFHVYEV